MWISHFWNDSDNWLNIPSDSSSKMFGVLLSEIYLGRQAFLQTLCYGREGARFSNTHSNLSSTPWCGWDPLQPCLREGWFWHVNTADSSVTWPWFFSLLLFKLVQASMASRFFVHSWGSRKSHALVKVRLNCCHKDTEKYSGSDEIAYFSHGLDHQAPLSMGFSRRGHWSGLPFSPPGDVPDPGVEPRPPALQVDSSPSEPPGKPFSLRDQSRYRRTGAGHLVARYKVVRLSSLFLLSTSPYLRSSPWAVPVAPFRRCDPGFVHITSTYLPVSVT